MDTQPHDPSYYCSFLLQWEGDNFGGTEISILNVSVYSFKINSIPHTSGSINILCHKLPEIKKIDWTHFLSTVLGGLDLRY